MLAEEELLPPDNECPVCGNSGGRHRLFKLQEYPRIDLLSCDCGCKSASRMPLPDVLRDYYSRYYAGTDDTATFDGAGRFARHLFRVLDAPVKDHMRILDFGGGVDAVLSRSLAAEFIRNGARKVDIALVDFNASCRRDWDNITVAHHDTIEHAGDNFDALVASAVIEHIPQPKEILLSLMRSLQPGGSAYFRTPAVASIIQAAARFGLRIDFCYPAHVHDMGQAFWEGLLASLGLTAGFELVRSRPSIVETDFSAHPSRTAMAYLCKLPWWLFGHFYTMVGGWEAVFHRLPPPQTGRPTAYAAARTPAPR
jgi:SAM-dependent methyltransferase